MSQLKRLLRHSSEYFSGQLLLLISHFVAFPVYTRILAVSDYGTLSYISSLMVLTVAFSKMGLQHSSVRFYAEIQKGQLDYPITHFYSTLYFTPVILGAIITCFISAGIILGQGILDRRLSEFLRLVALMIPLQCGVGIFTQFLRAEQRSLFFNLITVLGRYSTLFLAVTLVLTVTGDLWGIYYAQIICNSILFLFATWYLWVRRDMSLKYVSKDFLKVALAYGVPLAGYEFSSDILDYGDRIVVKHFLGIEAVALYSVGYNAPMYISGLFGTPIRLAVIPMYLGIWAEEGKEATQEFLSRALYYFALLAIPIMFGICAVKEEMILLLASDKYLCSHEFVPYIIVGTIIYGANPVLTAGLLLYKKTYFATIAMVAGTTLNIFLNLILIPRMGISGAALSTLIAYLAILFLNTFFSFRYLSFHIAYRSIAEVLLASAGMFFVVWQIELANTFWTLASKIAFGILIYGCLLLILHGRSRAVVKLLFRNLNRMFC